MCKVMFPVMHFVMCKRTVISLYVVATKLIHIIKPNVVLILYAEDRVASAAPNVAEAPQRLLRII